MGAVVFCGWWVLLLLWRGNVSRLLDACLLGSSWSLRVLGGDVVLLMSCVAMPVVSGLAC
eukprot:10187438-Prorocentrum_lima.AAC.1